MGGRKLRCCEPWVLLLAGEAAMLNSDRFRLLGPWGPAGGGLANPRAAGAGQTGAWPSDSDSPLTMDHAAASLVARLLGADRLAAGGSGWVV